jgi:hypothetical protein
VQEVSITPKAEFPYFFSLAKNAAEEKDQEQADLGLLTV